VAFTTAAIKGQRAVRLDPGDGPGVAVGDVQGGFVAAGGDPVTDPDPFPGRCRDRMGVVEAAGGDELVADGRVQGGDLFPGLGDHQDRLGRRPQPVVGRRSGRGRGCVALTGVQADLSSGEEGVEDAAGVLAGAHGQAEFGVVGVGEPVHGLQGQAGFGVGPAGGEI